MDNPFYSITAWRKMIKNSHRESTWKAKMLGEWDVGNDYVNSREEIEKSFAAGNITKGEAERLIRLRYKINRRGERVIESEKDEH